jgi:hypothetical protein
MKYLGYIFSTILAFAYAAHAGPLRHQEVAADARWVLHLDVDRFRSTPTGESLLQEAGNKLSEHLKQLFKDEPSPDLDLNKLKSVTVYGDFSGSNQVVILKSDLEIGKILEFALTQAAKHKGLSSWPLTKAERGGVTTYTLPDHVSIWVRPDNTGILSKSAEAAERANEVIDGRSPNLTSRTAFNDFPTVQKAFFFFGAAEGFNSSEELKAEVFKDGTNNPKAKILKMTESGRAVIGQDDDKLFLNISLKAKTSEVATHMQQVVQGMIALASLAQSDNEQVQQLAESAKVTTAGNNVNLSLSFPADKALLMLNQMLEHHGNGHSVHHGTNAPAKSDEK